MGCVNSKNSATHPLEEAKAQSRLPVEWKLLMSKEEARKKFEADGTLSKNSDPGHLELRALLEEPVAQHTLGKYAREKKSLDIFMCWIDIQEYKYIPTEDYRRSKALHIYHKYIKEGAVLDVGIDPAEKETFKEDLDKSKNDKDILKPGMFDKVQSKCFLEMYHNIFLPFKATDLYFHLTLKLKQKYNNVRTDDFEYYGKLGEGGFGLVIHGMKKSTRQHYALKVQTKRGLLDCFSDDPWRADYEKQAFASCQHPFIVTLDYAFQTESLAIMALGLANAGDLQKALMHSADERLSEERVQFYMAEVVLALAYLHQMGLMYRDLKPNNILLNSDGHIQLVDLGGVVDEKGKTLHHEFTEITPLFTQNYSKVAEEGAAENKAVENSNEPKRRMSIMGTFGYMAPEMVIMLGQTSLEKTGYSNAVDWWSLGVTTFKLLTGYRPFTEENFNAFVELASAMDHPLQHYSDVSPEYAMLFQEIPFPPYVSAVAKDFITQLLNVNEKLRLGSGASGVADIKGHPFFRGIDWELLEQKHVVPPFRPEVKPLNETPLYPNFDQAMKAFGKEMWLRDTPKKDDQKYFTHWDFTSPHTLRVEFGIANEMEQFDRNFKVRQIMGVRSTPNQKAPNSIKLF